MRAHSMVYFLFNAHQNANYCIPEGHGSTTLFTRPFLTFCVGGAGHETSAHTHIASQTQQVTLTAPGCLVISSSYCSLLTNITSTYRLPICCLSLFKALTMSWWVSNSTRASPLGRLSGAWRTWMPSGPSLTFASPRNSITSPGVVS